MEVSYPFLLKIHHDCVEGLITSDELKEILKLCISYVLRRAICEIPTNSMNKTFATLKNYIRPDDYLNSVKAFFVMQDTYKEFPDNEKFEGAFENRDIYNMRARNYILSRLENFDNKAPIIIENYTIEHIMPQNKNLSSTWQNMLGTDWEEIKEKYLHTLGNLTLTGYNSELGDKPFAEKKNLLSSVHTKVVALYEDVKDCDGWNKDTIEDRAEKLADKIIALYPIEMPVHEVSFKDPRYTEYTCENPDDATSKTPNYYVLQGERVIVGNFALMLRLIIEQLYEMDPSIIEGMARENNQPLSWSKMVLFSYSEDEVY